MLGCSHKTKEDKMKRKFWNWVRDADGNRTLLLNGTIAQETWYGDEVTPGLFREELAGGAGDITVWINSPGGDVFAAAQIYNMLMEYAGNVTVRIDGIAASAASVIAMAGTTVEISPVGMMMIHNPSTVAVGDAKEMQAAIEMLSETKESILNAYELKTGLDRAVLSDYMDGECWMNAKKAVELGFADKILFTDESQEMEKLAGGTEAMLFSRRAVTASFLDKLKARMSAKADKPQPMDDNRVSADVLKKRLSLILH